MIELFIDIKPRPAPRPRFSKKSYHVYQPAWYKKYLDEITRQIRLQIPCEPTAAPIALQITFYKNTRIMGTKYGDLDNLVKGVLDAMSNNVFFDDRQIISLQLAKLKSINQGIKISIVFLDYLANY